MLRMLGKAIKSVYASVFFSGSRSYIQTTANLLSEEKMAVVIQSICGTQHEGFFYPMLSGVARSINYYPLGKEKPEDGVVDMAFGLGKAVVDGGHVLRFSPRFPKKILQLSEPGLALRDTQKNMYALDLRPGAFKISKNDSINLAKIPVAEALMGFDHPELVASTFVAGDNRIVPGVNSEGARIISFDAILKYGRFPLPEILRDIMQICRQELMCDVEIEFAADIISEQNGGGCVLKLLQVRPISEFSTRTDTSFEDVRSKISSPVLEASIALGNGLIQGMKHILIINPSLFDSSFTEEMAREISQMNALMKSTGESYLLIGPGRWGSSDPWLGIPVLWSDISEARMIVECGIPGFRVEPSQGTHFFQNITSLGVGYLTIDTVAGNGYVDTDLIDSFEMVATGKFAKLVKAPSEIIAFIDRSNGKSVAGIL